jgi:hypothetical protein
MQLMHALHLVRTHAFILLRPQAESQAAHSHHTVLLDLLVNEEVIVLLLPGLMGGVLLALLIHVVVVCPKIRELLDHIPFLEHICQFFLEDSPERVLVLTHKRLLVSASCEFVHFNHIFLSKYFSTKYSKGFKGLVVRRVSGAVTNFT